MRITKAVLCAPIVGALLLTGCGGDGKSAAQPSASPSLGVIRHATVNFYQADGSTLIGSADTGATGEVVAPATTYFGPIVIEVLGDDDDADYFDEALGSYVPFPAGSSLHALSPSSSGAFAVTPLTELAYQGAVANGLFPITAGAVNALNDRVLQALAPDIGSILTPPTPFNDSTTSASLDDSDAGRYALILAALAQLGSSESAPALAVMEALVADLADGDIDGDNNGSPVTTPYNPGTFAADLAAALSDFADDYGDNDLQDAADGFSEVGTTLDFSGISNDGGDSEGAGCDSACQSFLSGVADTYVGAPDDTTLAQELATEFSGKSYTVVIATDGTITVSGETTDFTFSASEITMFESASNETNVFYEDAQSGYNVLLQEDNSQGLFLNISEPFVPGGGLDLANATLDLFLPK